jgi:hypothetical protein
MIENAPKAQFPDPLRIKELQPVATFPVAPKFNAQIAGDIEIGKALPHPSDNCEHPVNAKLSIVLIKPGYEDPGVTFAKLAIFLCYYFYTIFNVPRSFHTAPLGKPAEEVGKFVKTNLLT